MTTIAIKDGILAADTQLTWSNERHLTTKIKRIETTKIVIACAGSAHHEWRAHEIFGDPNWKSLELSEKAKDFAAIVVIDHKLHLCTSNYVPIPINGKYLAIGSGAAYALAAMYLGCSAVDSIKVASEFDVNTNKRIDTYDFTKET